VIGPVQGKDSSELDLENSEGCFEYISAFMSSESLLETENQVYQGLSHPCKDIRSDLKPLLSDSNVTDDAIFKHVMKITSDENERLRQLGPLTRTKQSTASSTQVHSEPGSDKRGRTEAAVRKSQNYPIKQLAVRIDALNNMVDAPHSP
ncbi:hypothetical protein QTP86_023456, partial [Hemibagrus guttatus]